MPLNLNKLDMRDYLWNVYGINSLAVRSYIEQKKVQQDKPGALRPAPRRWHRPRSIKHMLIEMDKPFAWPDEPKDLSGWDKETYDAAKRQREREQDAGRTEARTKASGERVSIREQARLLLRGEEKWVSNDTLGTPGSEEWEEVETDVDFREIDGMAVEGKIEGNAVQSLEPGDGGVRKGESDTDSSKSDK